ncbi:HU family DNA-binding protein [Rhodobacteraceae bacterium D3-12]|nr:HU family DNA-binding protein [Rhodobacteraceae bacterium D3-12]
MAPRKTTGRKTATTTRAASKKTTASKAKSPATAASATRKTAAKKPATTARKSASKAPVAGGASVTPEVAVKDAVKTPVKASAKVPAAAPVEPVVVSEVTPVVTGATLRKKEFIELVTEKAGIKRRDAKAALEAALEVLGEAIADGQEINLPGFGKLKVTRSKTLSNGKVFTTRIRQPLVKPDEGGTDKAGSEAAGDKDPLAEAAE